MHGKHTVGSQVQPMLEQLEPRLLLDSVPLDWPLASENNPVEWTIMAYLAADNNLEGAGIDDLNEMEVVGSTSSVNILVQLDRADGYDTSNGNWTDTRRGRVVQDVNTSIISTLLTSIGEVNMGTPATLTSFIQWGVTTYPASHYAIILWDHGGGTSGVCWDDTNNDHLTVAEVDQALTGSGFQMDIVGFDACLMGMMEQAYEIRDYADVMVASEKTEPWDGWPYDTFLADLVADPTQAPATLASSIVTRYGQSYGGAETLSAVDVPTIQSLVGDLDTFASTVIAEDTDWGAISAARTNASYFTYTDYRDLGTFIDGVVNYASNTNIITAAQAVQTTYASAVISNHSGSGEGATGLSIYLPAQGSYVSGSYTAANFDLLADTQWDEFLTAFTGTGSTGTDLDGSINDANSTGELPVTISNFIGVDGAEDVGGRDVDFYSLSVTAGEQISFDIDADETGGSLDSVLRLFDSDGLELDMNDDAYDPDTNQSSYDSYIEYTFTKTEMVHIAVSGYSNWSYDPWTTGSGTAGSTGEYNLLIRNLGEQVNDMNGTIPTATNLGSAPVSYVSAIGEELIGDMDVDFYVINVESNQTLTISVASGGSGLDAYLKLFTGNGTLLASDDNTNGVDPEIDYDFSSLGAGVYYIAVSGVPNTNYDPFALGSTVSGSTGTYILSVTGYSVHLDFDGVIPRANIIGTLPTSTSSAIGNEPAGSLDVDFYSFQVTSGDTVGFDIDAEELGYGLDAELRLFDQYGNELASSDDGTDPDSGFVGSDPYIEYTFVYGGTYYVAVSGAPNDVYSSFVETSGIPGDQGDYDLHVRKVEIGSDLNGTIPAADPSGGLPTTVVGSIGDEPSGALDVDFYAVDVLAGQRLGFDVDARDNGSPLDSILRLFDDSGTELAWNDDATDPDTGISSYDSYLTYYFSADGTYYIAVSGYSNDQYDPFVGISGIPGSTGDYEVLIREIVQNQVGPDGFGYSGYPVTPEFEDINGTGSAGFIPIVDDDYFHLSTGNLAGFEFDFYGITYQDLYVSSNGLITFGSGNDDYSNTDLTMFPFQATIAPYWDDLKVDYFPDAAVLWEVRGSGDQQRLIIQWNDIGFYYGEGEGQITFQAILNETDNSMQFNYLDLASSNEHSEGASATIGIKDAGSQTVGGYVLQISVDEGPNNFVGTGLSTRVDLRAPIVARHVFFNNSYFDGNDAGANAQDDNAIATDKQALLPGETATFANYTSYSRGINGIMVDIYGLTSTPTAADFTFKVGNDNDPSGWATVPIPSITVREGAGEGGSDRVTLIWADNAIQTEWLQVTVLSDANGGSLGLAEDDVFYFGNLPGEIMGNFSVADDDLSIVLSAFGDSVTPGDVSAGDLFADGSVDDSDLSILLSAFGDSINSITPPSVEPASASMAMAGSAYDNQDSDLTATKGEMAVLSSEPVEPLVALVSSDASASSNLLTGAHTPLAVETFEGHTVVTRLTDASNETVDLLAAVGTLDASLELAVSNDLSADSVAIAEMQRSLSAFVVAEMDANDETTGVGPPLDSILDELDPLGLPDFQQLGAL